MTIAKIESGENDVAPARERGLKFYPACLWPAFGCRSREGAWIEILVTMFWLFILSVAPARERGLKCKKKTATRTVKKVAPARERGLKCCMHEASFHSYKSLPRGSVD